MSVAVCPRPWGEEAGILFFAGSPTEAEGGPLARDAKVLLAELVGAQGLQAHGLRRLTDEVLKVIRLEGVRYEDEGEGDHDQWDNHVPQDHKP